MPSAFPRSARENSTLNLPRVFEVYVLRLATAAHNVAHFHFDCEFDEKKFSDKMKVRLYNSKRNKAWRDKDCGGLNPKPNADSAHVKDQGQVSATDAGGKRALDSVPAPTEPGDHTQEAIAAELVSQCLDGATKAGASFSCNVRLIRSAVHRRDPRAENVPLQNALKALLNGVRNNDVHETESAIKALEADVVLGKDM